MAKFESPGDLDFLLGYPAERLRLAVLVRGLLFAPFGLAGKLGLTAGRSAG